MDHIEARVDSLSRLVVQALFVVRYFWILGTVPAAKRSAAEREALRNLSIGAAYLGVVAGCIVALLVLDLSRTPALLLLVLATVCTFAAVRPFGRGYAQAKKIDDDAARARGRRSRRLSKR